MEQKNLSTPLTNRGVARPNESAVKAVVDWVQVTFHVGTISAIVNDVIGLPFDLFKHQEKGLYFYNRTYEFSNIKLYYSSNDESMGIHLQLTGSGCREMEHHLSQLNQNWTDFFKRCLEVKANFTRIDIAIDDFKTYLSIPKLIKKPKKRNVYQNSVQVVQLMVLICAMVKVKEQLFILALKKVIYIVVFTKRTMNKHSN